MTHIALMRSSSAGIREARQNLSALVEEVGKGHEVILTDRGKPVARLVPVVARSSRPFKSHAEVRARVALRGTPLSSTIADGREDRF